MLTALHPCSSFQQTLSVPVVYQYLRRAHTANHHKADLHTAASQWAMDCFVSKQHTVTTCRSKNTRTESTSSAGPTTGITTSFPRSNWSRTERWTLRPSSSDTLRTRRGAVTVLEDQNHIWLRPPIQRMQGVPKLRSAGKWRSS